MTEYPKQRPRGRAAQVVTILAYFYICLAVAAQQDSGDAAEPSFYFPVLTQPRAAQPLRRRVVYAAWRITNGMY